MILGPREAQTAQSAITVTPELQAAVNKCSTPEEIKAVMRAEALRSGVAVVDADGAYQPTALAANPPKKFGGYITDTTTGKKVYVESDSPEGLNAAMAEVLKGATTDQQRDPATGRFVEQHQQQTQQPSEAERAQLQAQFSLGQITLDEYLQKTGAVNDYLACQGVDVEALKSVSDERRQESSFVANWADATAQFLAEPNNDWPGGAQNLSTLARIAEANGLSDQPSVSTIRKIYDFMKENGLLEHQREELAEKLAEAKSSQELREALGHGRYNHSQLFGR